MLVCHRHIARNKDPVMATVDEHSALTCREEFDVFRLDRRWNLAVER